MRTGLAPLVLVLLIVIGASEAAGPGASDPSVIVRRQLDAAVSRVDFDAGVLLLKTDVGRLTLAAPVDATRLVRKGDWVVLDVALLRHLDPAGLPRDEGAHQPLLVRRLTAEVMSVQRGIGIVALKTSAGRINVDLPPAAIAGLRTGDRLLLELAVRREVDVAALPRMETQTRRDRLAVLLLSIFSAARSDALSRP